MTTGADQPRTDALRTAVFLRILGGDLAATPVWFGQDVLDRYRGQPGCRVMRTNSAGRVKAAAGWSLDFGIADGDRLIHAPVGDVSQRVPAGERAHWAQHAVTPPASQIFLTMRMGGGSCIDDGELRDWPGVPAEQPSWGASTNVKEDRDG